MSSLVLVGSLFVTATAAGAQESDVYVTEPPPEVLAEIELPPGEPRAVPGAELPAAEAQVLGAQEPEVAGAQARAEGLAFTGGDAVGLALIGGAALAGGAGLLAVRRRSASS